MKKETKQNKIILQAKCLGAWDDCEILLGRILQSNLNSAPPQRTAVEGEIGSVGDPANSLKEVAFLGVFIFSLLFSLATMNTWDFFLL